MTSKKTNVFVLIACGIIILVALFFAGVGIYAGVEGISYGDALSNIFNGIPAESVETPEDVLPDVDSGDVESEATI